MELDEYVKIIGKNKKLILFLGVVVSVSAFVFSVTHPVKYEASLSLFIIKSETQETNDFKYDGYYSIKTSGAIADFIKQILKSPEVVGEICEKSDIDCGLKNIKNYKKKFKADKMSDQYVNVEFKTETREEAEKISSSIIKVISDKIKLIKDSSNQEISFVVKSEEPTILEEKQNAVFNAAIGFISGIFFGFFFVLGRIYFYGDKTKTPNNL